MTNSGIKCVDKDLRILTAYVGLAYNGSKVKLVLILQGLWRYEMLIMEDWLLLTQRLLLYT